VTSRGIGATSWHPTHPLLHSGATSRQNSYQGQPFDDVSHMQHESSIVIALIFFLLLTSTYPTKNTPSADYLLILQ
jgi:hypothetical protein